MNEDRAWLANLVAWGKAFRATPIVDDDFPSQRDFFDAELDRAEEHLRKPRPEIVCLCGSTRFMEAWQEANLRLTLEGKIVLSVGCNTKSDADLQRAGGLTDEIKVKLDELHLRKIDLADSVMILNVGGYVGDSTRREIEYAKAKGKPVRYLEPV